jgi:hypothetical protein
MKAPIKPSSKKLEKKAADQRHTRLTRASGKHESTKTSPKKPHAEPTKKTDSPKKVPMLAASKAIKKAAKPAKTAKLAVKLPKASPVKAIASKVSAKSKPAPVEKRVTRTMNVKPSKSVEEPKKT